MREDDAEYFNAPPVKIFRSKPHWVNVGHTNQKANNADGKQ